MHRSFQTQTLTNTQVHTYTQIHANTLSTHTHHVSVRQEVSRNGPSSVPGKAGSGAQGGWAAGPAGWPPGSRSGV